MLGRLDRQKGILAFVEAAAHSLKEREETEFVVHGDGQLRDSAERLAIRLGVDEKITFKGWVSEGRATHSGIGILVLPSVWEGMPYVLLEAMALGRQVVAASVNGIPEVLQDHRNGLLISPDDPLAIARAVLTLLEDRAFGARLGQQAARDIHEWFGVGQMATRTMAVYEEALGLADRVYRLGDSHSGSTS